MPGLLQLSSLFVEIAFAVVISNPTSSNNDMVTFDVSAYTEVSIKRAPS